MEAGVAGAFINGAAGDRVFAEKGYHILPEDVVKRIPGVIEDAVAGKMRAR
jgi:NAD(P)H-hydrate repair Nnr-like enzyme with NAD(P)H-hydrate dehydratase domain